MEVVITSGTRTPVGSFNGSLSTLPAHRLGEVVIQEAVRRAQIDPAEVSEVIMGQTLTAGQGQNPARQAAVNGGIPVEVPATGVNQLCGSGLRSIAMGYQAILNGDSKIVVAGGQENMSQAPHCAAMREGHRIGGFEFIDTMLKDGLWDAFHGYHMGNTAENVARQWQITREEQDRYAVSSQNRAEKAQAEGRFKDEIVPVVIKNRQCEVTVSEDEHIRKGVTLESVSGLRPVFDPDGTVTAANSSGINDGAAAVVLMSEQAARARGTAPMARIVSWAQVGVDPAIMGAGPIPASKRALERAGWKVDDLDLIEANEAFAAQVCAVNKDLCWNVNKVNVNGGAIAIGHPLGASGTRVLVTLLYEMQRRDVQRGLATLCVGGGMGIAMCIERV